MTAQRISLSQPSGATNFRTFVLQAARALPASGHTYLFAVGDYDHFRRYDLVAVHRNDPRGTEVHILSSRSWKRGDAILLSMKATNRQPRAKVLYDEIERAGVTHVVGVPDNASAALFHLLAQGTGVGSLTVTREGEAFAVASGLWLGGAKPVVLIQNTGLLESGDSLRGTAVRMGVPLVCCVTYRGYAKLPVPGAETHHAMTRSDVDSVAVLTEPTLDAWRIPYELYRSDDDLPRFRRSFERANTESRPVAVLLTTRLV